MRVAIVIEAIPPYCGGAEQVAWIHAVEMAKKHEVTVVTFGDAYEQTSRDGVKVYSLPKSRHKLTAYCTTKRALLNDCLEDIAPEIIHCHMPNVLSACINKKGRLMVSTIHDGTPENELLDLKLMPRTRWLKFKLIRRINVNKSDLITCVSRYSRDVMCELYPRHAGKFSFIPNPIYERFFAPTKNQDCGYILNFGRQIELKMGALLRVARRMPETQFLFVGTGEMLGDYGLPNVKFAGFSASVEEYIDAASICVFPSLSENFPLVGLEAMARGKPIIATRRGFSEYIKHMHDGFLLESTEPSVIEEAITLLMGDKGLRDAMGQNARLTAEQYRPRRVVEQYEELYQSVLRHSHQ